MKKILSALLFTLPFLFAGCGDDSPNNTTGGGDITPPTEKKFNGFWCKSVLFYTYS